MKESYWNEEGKYQDFVDQISEKMPSFGYTSNVYMNLFITMSNLYYDVYNNGGCNIEDNLLKDFKRHVKPLLPKIDVSAFLSGNERKMEEYMDNVFAYLQDKSLDYAEYPVWWNYKERSFSFVAQLITGDQDWSQVMFGIEAERTRWCSEQETFSHAKDVTAEIAAQNEKKAGQYTKESLELPDMCFSIEQVSGELICLQKGMMGYSRSDWSVADRAKNQATADLMNERLGVTAAQVKAMEIGSLFGWDKPGANPKVYIKQSLQEQISGAESRNAGQTNNAPDRDVPAQQR